MLKKLLPALGAALLAQAAAAQSPAVPLDSLRARASHTLHAKRYAEAAALFEQQAQAEPVQSARASAYYNLACARALAGQPRPALQALARAQRLGFRNVDLARTDTDLTSLHDRPEYRKTMARLAQADARLNDPNKARLITTDITHFWRAYDRVARDTAQAEAIYQRDYFAKASRGLQDYFELRIRTVRDFVQNQRAKPRFYQAIRPSTLRIATMTPQIRAGFAKLKEIYPAARFPDVYFVIGRWNSAGTVSSSGMLIGADQLCGTPSTPVDELSAYGRRSLGTLAQLPYVVAHEHIHTLQKPNKDLSLLRGAINEGMADFLAELTTGHQPNASLLPYGLAHEKQIWVDFTREITSKDWSNWIANGRQETADKPADLGYFVGYRICQSYYEELADKKQAVHDILNISDFSAFLAKSRYAEKLAAR